MPTSSQPWSDAHETVRKGECVIGCRNTMRTMQATFSLYLMLLYIYIRSEAEWAHFHSSCMWRRLARHKRRCVSCRHLSPMGSIQQEYQLPLLVGISEIRFDVEAVQDSWQQIKALQNPDRLRNLHIIDVVSRCSNAVWLPEQSKDSTRYHFFSTPLQQDALSAISCQRTFFGCADMGKKAKN